MSVSDHIRVSPRIQNGDRALKAPGAVIVGRLGGERVSLTCEEA